MKSGVIKLQVDMVSSIMSGYGEYGMVDVKTNRFLLSKLDNEEKNELALYLSCNGVWPLNRDGCFYRYEGEGKYIVYEESLSCVPTGQEASADIITGILKNRVKERKEVKAKEECEKEQVIEAIVEKVNLMLDADEESYLYEEPNNFYESIKVDDKTVHIYKFWKVSSMLSGKKKSVLKEHSPALFTKFEEFSKRALQICKDRNLVMATLKHEKVCEADKSKEAFVKRELAKREMAEASNKVLYQKFADKFLDPSQRERHYAGFLPVEEWDSALKQVLLPDTNTYKLYDIDSLCEACDSVSPLNGIHYKPTSGLSESAWSKLKILKKKTLQSLESSMMFSSECLEDKFIIDCKEKKVRCQDCLNSEVINIAEITVKFAGLNLEQSYLLG